MPASAGTSARGVAARFDVEVFVVLVLGVIGTDLTGEGNTSGAGDGNGSSAGIGVVRGESSCVNAGEAALSGAASCEVLVAGAGLRRADFSLGVTGGRGEIDLATTGRC